MTAEAIDAQIPDHDQVRSLKGALGVDARFVLTARDRWGLAEWDAREYRGIAEEIGRVLDEHAGQIRLADLQHMLVAQFGVSPNSVYAYATRGAFGVQHGVVRRVGPRTLHTLKSPFLSKRVYRAEDAWTYRIVVNHDHLRGSGFPMPIALGAAIGIVDHEPKMFSSNDGPQTVHWDGGQVSSGSIRRFLDFANASLGDVALLRFLDDGGFELELLDMEGPMSAASLRRLIGADEEVDLLAAVADALGLHRGSRAEVIERLEQRDEGDIAALLATL